MTESAVNSGNSVPSTQRAYTLRLRGIDDTDTTWRDALWATHEAVNKGAKAFGDWLLTLRGGLDHQLADEGSAEQLKDRRILLALSWLSVESEKGAPIEQIIVKGSEPSVARQEKVLEALRKILQKRGISTIDGWLADCGPSLSAAIRDDAVWVNRSKAFDLFSREIDGQVDRQYACRTVLGFYELKGPYFTLPKLSDDDEGATSATADEGPLVNEATGWLCDNWGAGKKSDKAGIAGILNDLLSVHFPEFVGKSGSILIRELCRIAGAIAEESQSADEMLASLIGKIGWQGRPSASRMAMEAIAKSGSVSEQLVTRLQDRLRKESVGKLAESKIIVPTWMPQQREEIESEIGLSYRDQKDRTFEFAVMLDHALRRLSGAHSWIKRAEAERQAFEEDATKIGLVSEAARIWLDAFCRERSTLSGTVDEPYRIRKRALGGWDQVVAKWSSAKCRTKEDRIVAAREVQTDPEIDKFGDIQLFEALAEDDALSVWREDGKTVPEHLKHYAAATDAEAKKRRFKVPAYRHPDAMLHPVFCDFGNSRWGIRFGVHQAREGLPKQQQVVEKRQAEVVKQQAALDKAKTPEKQASAQMALDNATRRLKEAMEVATWLSDRHALAMDLWTGQTLQADCKLRWSSKRFASDLALRQARSEGEVVGVTRADRLGRAASGAAERTNVELVGLFEEPQWNGRLQAPRSQLEAIAAYVEKHGWDEKAYTKRNSIRWLISFTAKLQPKGPWIDYTVKFSENSPAMPSFARNGEYYVKHQSQNDRKRLAKLDLCRLPGLRVLSVDLGHRYAAACAVWEVLSATQMRVRCKAAGVAVPSASVMYMHLKGKNGKGKPTTTIYRRIGSDALPDKSAHPTPWARLDRQFLIKLQGEEGPARKSSPDEIKAVETFEKWAGLDRSKDDLPQDLAADALMNDTVRTARLALARHGRRARIAFHLTTDHRILSGDRQEKLKDQTRLELLTDMLIEWHGLASDDRWLDAEAESQWNEHLAKLPGGFDVRRRKDTTELTKEARRKEEEELGKRCEPLAQTLAGNLKLRQKLNAAWTARWNIDDKAWRNKLKWLSRWLMPRGGAGHDAGRHHVGGLSLTRLSTLTEFRRKVQVGFFTRLKPDGARAEIGPHFGQATLDIIERLKDNRVKQLASRITGAALGLGGHWKEVETKRKNKDGSPRMKSVWVEESTAKYPPCHAVVIEDLSHYRPEETRTRRENRATMDWKSAEARKRLADHCQLHGLLLRDINPQYTSRQDSRTGAPGVRCVDVPVKEFMTGWWQKQVKAAEKKRDENGGSVRDRYLLALKEKYGKIPESKWKDQRPCRIPVKGGELFVSADSRYPAARGLQADLNAAANIGLRALLDPDFAGKWWYVPCKAATNIPEMDKVGGCPLFDGTTALGVPPELIAENGDATPPNKRSKGKGKVPREIVNRWHDVSATPPLDDKAWQSTGEYWAKVEYRVTEKLLRDLSK